MSQLVAISKEEGRGRADMKFQLNLSTAQCSLIDSGMSCMQVASVPCGKLYGKLC